MCDVFNGVTQTVSVVIRRINTPKHMHSDRNTFIRNKILKYAIQLQQLMLCILYLLRLYCLLVGSTPSTCKSSISVQVVHTYAMLVWTHFQATLSKLLTYCVLRSTQPPTFSRMEMSSSLRSTTWKISAYADWGARMSASCKPRV